MNGKRIERFGKSIIYSIDSINGSWLLVKDGGQKWLHLTNKDLDTPRPNMPLIFVNRKGMWDLLVHFGCDREDLKNVYKREVLFD